MNHPTIPPHPIFPILFLSTSLAYFSSRLLLGENEKPPAYADTERISFGIVLINAMADRLAPVTALVHYGVI